MRELPSTPPQSDQEDISPCHSVNQLKREEYSLPSPRTKQSICEGIEELKWSLLSETAGVSIDAVGKIVFWDEVAQKLFGWTRDDVIGRDLSILIPNDHATSASAKAARCLEGIKRAVEAKTSQAENKIVAIDVACKDGTTVPADMIFHLSQIPHGGRVVFYVVMSRRLERIGFL